MYYECNRLRLYSVRLPEKHLQMIGDIARNKGLKIAEVLREAVAEYLGQYSTLPSMKQVSIQLERHEQDISEIKKVLLKKGVME